MQTEENEKKEDEDVDMDAATIVKSRLDDEVECLVSNLIYKVSHSLHGPFPPNPAVDLVRRIS